MIPQTTSEAILPGGSKSHLQELVLTRKRILADLRRIQLIDAEPAQVEKLQARRRLKEQLKIVNTAIKAAGGKIKGPAVITY